MPIDREDRVVVSEPEARFINHVLRYSQFGPDIPPEYEVERFRAITGAIDAIQTGRNPALIREAVKAYYQLSEELTPVAEFKSEHNLSDKEFELMVRRGVVQIQRDPIALNDLSVFLGLPLDSYGVIDLGVPLAYTLLSASERRGVGRLTLALVFGDLPGFDRLLDPFHFIGRGSIYTRILELNSQRIPTDVQDRFTLRVGRNT